MTDVFADPDDDAADITLDVIGNTTPRVISAAAITGKTLNYSVVPGEQGVVVLTVKAKAGIRTALTTVTVNVGVPPVVMNPIPSVAVIMNSEPITRDLSNTFHDPDGIDAEIVKTIESNSNPGLVTPDIDGDLLTLTFAANKTGTSVITVEGKSGELSVTTFFNVVVTSSAELVVLNPIQPVKVEKNAPDSLIDLTNVFYNMPDPNATITITVTDNSNSSLVSTSISGYDLVLSFASESEGAADITLHATAGALSVDHTFQVGVGDVDLIVVNNAPADMQIGNDPSVETVIPLTGVFSVVGNPDAVVSIDFSYTNPTLLNAYINNQTNELVISSANSSTGSCVFTLTGTYGNATVTTQFTVTILVTGIAKIDVKTIRLYPVPVVTTLYCSFAGDEEVVKNIRNIQIISLAGMVVKSYDSSVIVERVAELDVENLSSGSYLLRINSNQGSVTKMFIK
jgi:hypothetical protein